MALTEKQAPFIVPYAVVGNIPGLKSKGNTAIAVKRALSHLGFLEWDDGFGPYWNHKLNNACADWKRKRGLIPSNSEDGSWGRKAHTVMQSAWYIKAGKQLPAFDGKAQELLQDEKAGQEPPPDPVPDLGSVWNGGLTVLQQDLTHPTEGIPLYPAYDDAFQEGREIIAPDVCEVWKKDTSASPGEAVYLKGLQKVDFWLGHIDRDYNLGVQFKKGQFIARVAPQHTGGGPHCHVGVNVERLIGAGKQLVGHTNYTHGAPLVGVQLRALLK
jgi:hypothetical protein